MHEEETDWQVFIQVFPDIHLERPVQLPNGCVLTNPHLGADLLYGPRELRVKTADFSIVQQLSQSLEIESDTYYWCVISDANPDGAVKKVMRNFDPIVRLGLQMATGMDVSTAPIQVIDQATNERRSADLTTASFRGAGKQVDVDILQVSNVVRDLDKADFLPALDFLRKGDSYKELAVSAGTLAEDAALLEYAKAIEYLTKGEGSRKDADHERKRDEIVDRLQKEMMGNKSPVTLAKRIRGAGSEINDLGRQTVVMRVESFADRMSMSEYWKQTTVDLIRTRNKFLAHPGEGLPRSARGRLSGARTLVVDAIFASLPTGAHSRNLRVWKRQSQQRLEPGPAMHWSPARRKVYRRDGKVEWVTQKGPEE